MEPEEERNVALRALIFREGETGKMWTYGFIEVDTNSEDEGTKSETSEEQCKQIIMYVGESACEERMLHEEETKTTEDDYDIADRSNYGEVLEPRRVLNLVKPFASAGGRKRNMEVYSQGGEVAKKFKS